MAVYPIGRAKLATARARVASLVAGKSFPIDLSLLPPLSIIQMRTAEQQRRPQAPRLD